MGRVVVEKLLLRKRLRVKAGLPTPVRPAGGADEDRFLQSFAHRGQAIAFWKRMHPLRMRTALARSAGARRGLTPPEATLADRTCVCAAASETVIIDLV